MKIKIALLQISPCKTLEDNRLKGIAACKEAAKEDVDIILFPEMWSNGYDIYDTPPEVWTKNAIPSESDFVNTFSRLSKQLNTAIGITYLEKYNGTFRNTLTLFDRFGENKFTYAKVHTCDFSAENALTAGDDFYVCELDTKKGNLNIGAMICYDREFPESARILMLKGAELVLVPNACPMEINRLSQLRGRAYENMMAIATCNYPDTVPDCNGGSSVFDGVVYLPDLEGSRDTCVFLASGNEEICIAELDMDMLREYRNTEVHGNCYRRPSKYSILTEEKISSPFIRPDRRD